MVETQHDGLLISDLERILRSLNTSTDLNGNHTVTLQDVIKKTLSPSWSLVSEGSR